MKRNAEGGLAAALDQALEARAKFVPECDPKTYTTNVYHRELVKDCDTITSAEEKDMSDGLISAGRRSAGAICELNKQCPRAQLLSYKFKRIKCENRLWEVDLEWTFKCVQ